MDPLSCCEMLCFCKTEIKLHGGCDQLMRTTQGWKLDCIAELKYIKLEVHEGCESPSNVPYNVSNNVSAIRFPYSQITLAGLLHTNTISQHEFPPSQTITIFCSPSRVIQ